MLKPDEESPFRLNKAGLGQTFVVPGLLAASTPAREAMLQIGVASVDITPDYPIRLNGSTNVSRGANSIECLWGVGCYG